MIYHQVHPLIQRMGTSRRRMADGHRLLLAEMFIRVSAMQ